MPNPGAERQLRKVTLNLFEEDCADMELAFGQGWTVRIREWVREKTWSIRKHKPRTLSDLDHIGDYDE